jgi:hypothetical protein
MQYGGDEMVISTVSLGRFGNSDLQSPLNTANARGFSILAKSVLTERKFALDGSPTFNSAPSHVNNVAVGRPRRWFLYSHGARMHPSYDCKAVRLPGWFMLRRSCESVGIPISQRHVFALLPPTGTRAAIPEKRIRQDGVALDFWVSERLSDNRTISYGSLSWVAQGF